MFCYAPSQVTRTTLTDLPENCLLQICTPALLSVRDIMALSMTNRYAFAQETGQKMPISQKLTYFFVSKSISSNKDYMGNNKG